MLYKYLNHEGKKYPIRISNCVLGEYQEECEKTDLRTMTYRDIRILLWHALKEGHEFADQKFELTIRDVKLMVDNTQTVQRFLLLLPEFFPGDEEEKEGEDAELGKSQPPAKT